MDLNRKYSNKKLEAKRQKILAEKEQARILVAKKPRFGQVRQIIEDAYEMSKEGAYYRTPGYGFNTESLCGIFRSFPPGCIKNKEDFYNLLVLAEEETDLFDSGPVNASNFAQSLADLARWSEFWIRDPSTWKCRTHNIWRQFSTLTRHLLAKYDVPSFMDSAWSYDGPRDGGGDRKKFQEWYIHIGSGQNIRTAHGLPMTMTKKVAHYFLEAPSSYGIMNAFRFGHIRSLGGHEYVARYVNATFLGTDFRNNEFWESVFRFFIENPMMPHDQIGPIIDYINNQRYVNRIEIINGETINHGPAQPGFCMKGRTPEGILDQVDKWHHQLARSKKYASVNWKPCKFSPMEFTEGSEHNKKVYSIVELLSTAALREEGKLMHHCVATYAGGCASGRDAIFTLGYTQRGSYYKMVTIRVSPGYSKIEEVRGNYNAKPDAVSARIIRAWAQQVGLSFSSWALL